MEKIIISLASLFFIGHSLQWFFVKTKIPDLLILILIGFCIGPSGFQIISYQHIGQVGTVLATVTLIIILYEGGLNLKASSLLASSMPALFLSLSSFLLVAGVTTACLAPFFTFSTALLVGLGIGSTSSAIVFPMIQPLNITEKTKTILSLESAFTDVLAIIAFLTVLDSLLSQNYAASVFLFGFGAKPFLSIILGIMAALLWAFLRKTFPNLLKISFATESWSLFTYGCIELFNLNGPIGILAFGFSLSNLNILPRFMGKIFHLNPVSQNEMSLLKEISFLLKTFFFLYLGMLMKFSALNIFVMACLLTFLMFVTRYISVRMVFSKNKVFFTDALISMGMGPRGLACAVLATLPLQKGYIHGEFIQNLIFYIILVSIISTSLFVIFGQKSFFQNIFKPLFLGYKTSEDVEDQDNDTLVNKDIN